MSERKLCIETDCDRAVAGRGMCRSHYNQWRKVNQSVIDADKVKPPKLCGIDECGRPHSSRGLCASHAQAARDGRDPALVVVGKNAPVRRYTDQEMAIISDYSIGHTAAARQVGVSPRTVALIRKELDLGTLRLANWLDSELDFIADSMNKMTTAAMAAYLQRSTDEVVNEIRRLREAGILGARSKKSLNPSAVGTRVLIAKTCETCGDLLTAELFGQAKGAWREDCRECRSKDGSSRYAESSDRWQKLQAEYTAKMQAVTSDKAVNNGKEWTEKDVEVLKDPNKTVLEKALELGRTYSATATATSRFGLSSKRPNWTELKKSEWHLFWEFTEMELAS